MRQSSPKEIADMLKCLVRPYIIVSSWTVWLLMTFTGAEVPALLSGIAGTITIEYGIERAVKRFKGK